MRTIAVFSLIGMAGFIVDSLIFIWLSSASDHVMLSRLVAFWLAATTTWLGNRYLTFKARQSPPVQQWFKHIVSCHISGSFNLTVFYICISEATLPISFALGVAVGTVINYLLSSIVVFRERTNKVNAL